MKSKKVVTTEICSFGCGRIASFYRKSRKGQPRWICERLANSCPAVKKRNSDTLKLAYKKKRRLSGKELYNSLPESTKIRMNWNKGNSYCVFGNPGTGGKSSFKRKLIAERGHKCEECTKSTWLEKPITLEMEHSDGNKKNNTRKNLRLLCPNCHSYTPTWRRQKSCL